MGVETETMTEEAALKIVGALVLAAVAHMGIPGLDRPDVAMLRGLTLRQMIDANETVKAINTRPTAPGPRTIHSTIDDRGTAAIYALLHHEASRVEVVEPIVMFEGPALCPVAVRSPDEETSDGN